MPQFPYIESGDDDTPLWGGFKNEKLTHKALTANHVFMGTCCHSLSGHHLLPLSTSTPILSPPSSVGHPGGSRVLANLTAAQVQVHRRFCVYPQVILFLPWAQHLAPPWAHCLRTQGHPVCLGGAQRSPPPPFPYNWLRLDFKSLTQPLAE